MNADLHTLTGAYALHALSDDERAEFELHLGECAACRREVAELEATAARLGAAVAQTPPEELRAAVLSGIRRVRQLPPSAAPSVAVLRRRRWPLAVAGLAAAAAAVVAVVLGVRVVGLGGEIERAETRATELQRGAAQLAEVLAAPDARVVRGGGEVSATVVVSSRLDKVAFVPGRMPAPADGRTYQLWLIGPDGARSAGLLPAPAHPVVTPLRSGAEHLGVTLEPTGGSRQPTSDPVLLIRL